MVATEARSDVPFSSGVLGRPGMCVTLVTSALRAET